MLAPVVVFAFVLLVVTLVRIRRWWRRRDDPPMIVTTWPEIEYHQTYGGWNAEAYDAGTGHDRSFRRPPYGAPGRGVRSRPGLRSR